MNLLFWRCKMRSKVKFIYRTEDDKRAYIEPASEFLKSKLQEYKGRQEIMVAAEDGNLGTTVLENLLFIEVLAYEDLDDDRIFLVREEIIALREMRLLLKIYKSLADSKDPQDKKLYQGMKKKLSDLKAAYVAEKMASREKDGEKTFWAKVKEGVSKVI